MGHVATQACPSNTPGVLGCALIYLFSAGVIGMPGAYLRFVINSVRLALCLAIGLASVSAATLERLSLDDMIAKSTAIVHGRITGSSAAWRGTVIYTDFKVSVLAQWKGAAQKTVDVLVPGGIANGVRQTYPGAPEFTIGQEYVLFLWTSSTTGATYTLGFTQGVFSLPQDSTGQTMAVRAPTTETILDPKTGQVLKDQPISMPLSQLISLISSGVATN